MADNFQDGSNPWLAADDLGSGVKIPRVKMTFGADGSAADVSGTNPLPAGKGQQTVTDCVISNGQSLSASVDLGVYRLVGISIPSTFEPTTLTFQSSYDGSTWANVFKDGIEVSEPVGTNRRIVLDPSKFYGIRYVKVRGGTSGSATTVSADRTLKLIAEA